MKTGFLPAVALGASIAVFGAQAGAQSALSGSVSLSAGMMGYTHTDGDHSGIVPDLGIEGNIGMAAGDWMFSLDANAAQFRDASGNFDHYAPWGVASYGVHAGRMIGDAYVGAFFGGNSFQGNDASNTNGYVTGTLWGVEGQFSPAGNGNLSVFGQIGRADMVGDTGDTAFIGSFARLGLDIDTGNGFGFTIAAEGGFSPDIFEDAGDWGKYRLVTLEGRYQAGNLVYSIGGEMGQFTANTEDFATTNRLFARVSIPFGPAPKRNLLKTPYGPGLAAAWAETLD